MTREEIRRLLDGLQLRGNHVVVHVALSTFGSIDGDGRTLCEALIEAVGDAGTVVMPAFTHTETVRDEPGEPRIVGRRAARGIAFHPDLAVNPELGVTAEAFRHLAGVMRSNHPTHSFAAWGRQAREVLSTQRDNNPMGPLKKLNVMQGQVLLLGATLASASAVHLAEEMAHVPYLTRKTALRINTGGYEERVVVENFPGCSAAFVKLEAHIDPSKVRSLPLPQGSARKIPIRYLVNLAAGLLQNDARIFVCDDENCVSCSGKRHALGMRPRSAVNT